MRLQVTPIIGAALWLLCAPQLLSGEEPIDFDREIRPLLSDKCFFCHGPDESNREADLRLDLEESAKDYAIVPGDPGASEMHLRIWSDEEDIAMPPR